MKFIPLSFLKACFYWKFRKTWFLLKMYCNECWKPLSQKLLLEVSLFKFHFVATLQYLDRYYNKYPVKQTALLYLKLPSSNLHFLMCFCYFWKDKPLPILTLFRMGIFGAVHGWGRAKKAPLPKICHTYPTMMKLGTVIPYPNFIQKIYESRDTTPAFC